MFYELELARRAINGFSTSKYLKLVANGREADILALLLPGSNLKDLSTYTLHTTELKTIMSTIKSKNLRSKTKDISLDAISLIIDALEIWSLTDQFRSGQIQGFKQISDFASGIYSLSDGEQRAKETLRYILGKILNTNDLESKGALDLQLYHQVTSFLNIKIQGTPFTDEKAVKTEIERLLNKDSIVQDAIKDIAEKVYRASSIGYGKTKWDILKSDWKNEYRRLKRMFSKEFSNILASLPNNQYELVWQDSITHSFLRFESGAVVGLDGAMLISDPNFFGIAEYDSATTQWNIRNRAQVAQDEMFDVPMVVFHEKASGQWGLIRSDQLKYFKNLDRKYELGFKSSSGEVLTDVILNTKEGYILDGRVALEGNRLHDRGEHWFERYLDDSDYFTDVDGVFTFNNFYRNIMHITGTHIVTLLQESTYNFVPTSTYEPYFKEEGIQRVNKLKQLIHDYAVSIDPDRYDIEGMSEKINALCNFLYQVGGEHTMQMLQEIAPKIFVSENYLNAFSKENRYSIPLFKDILKALTPKAGDPLYSDSGYDFTFDPSHDSSDSLYWLNLISRSYLENNERKVRILEQKQFYNAWLKLLQNDFARSSSKLETVLGSKKVSYYENLLQGKSFTSGSKLAIDETGSNIKDDFKLIEMIDLILQDLFGYNTFTDLISGILSFSEDYRGLSLDWILHSKGEQSNLISKWGFRTLSIPHKIPLRSNYLYASKKLIFGEEYSMSSWYFSNIKVNGFWRLFSGQRVTSTGIYRIENYRIDTMSTDQSFIKNYFSSYKNLDFRLYAKANNLFLSNEFSKLLDQKWMNKMNVLGRGKIQELFYKRIVAALVPTLMLFTEQFASDHESWYIRTVKISQIFARTFIDDPTYNYDFARQLRDIILSGKDGYITLEAHRDFAGNELLADGLEIFIPYKEAIRYIDDIWFTLNFYADESSSMHPDYQLDIDLVLPALGIKIINLYKNFYDLFSNGPCDKYKIIFTTENGKGIGTPNSFSLVYKKKFGFTRGSITLDRTKLEDFQQKVASLVFYLVFIPKAFAVITSGIGLQSPKFVYADALGLYTHEYVQSSDFAEKNYGGSFVWTETSGLYTPENYKVWIQSFKVIFRPTDLRLFTAFSNKEGIKIIDYLMKFFNEFLGMYKDMPGVELDDFKGIEDLRK